MPKKTPEHDVPGYGIEDQWAMTALRRIVSLGKTGELASEPFYADCPPLSTTEADEFGRLIDQGRVGIGILPFGVPTFITHKIVTRRGQPQVRINMRCDVAAVVRGIMGFDDIVYRAQNRNLVQTVKDILSRLNQAS